MTCDCNKKKPYTIVSADELDIDDLASMPDYFLGLRTITDPSTGVTKSDPVRIPGEKVMPNGNLANVVAIATNNTSLVIPENQVRAGYIDTQPGGNVVRYADSTHPAKFLMLGKYTDGKMLIQTTGFLTINAGHQYIPGQQYYLGDEGQPITAGDQKLFYALTDKVLNINGEF